MSIISNIPNMLFGLPDAILSVLVGSTITLIGVVFSNWGNTKRLKVQLEHSSKEASRAWANNIKKEVYFEFISSLENVRHVFANLPVVVPGQEDRVSAFYGPVSKLFVIVKPDKSNLVAMLITTHIEAANRLQESAKSMQTLNEKIKWCDKRQDILSTWEHAMIEKALLSPETPIDIETRMNVTRSELANIAKAREDAIEELEPLMSKYLDLTKSELGRIGDLAGPITLMIRSDLGID